MTEGARSILSVKVFMESDVTPGMVVEMSRPRKSWGVLNLHLKCFDSSSCIC